MDNITIFDAASRINGNMTINGVTYRFYNNGHPNGGYKMHPIADGDRTRDGNWEIIQRENGFELITNPSLFEEPMFISMSLIPESVLDKTIKIA